MQTYSDDELRHMAETGSLKNRLIVAFRTNAKPDLIAYLMEVEPHDELKLAIMSRTEVTEEQLVWAAQHSRTLRLS